MLTIIQKLDGKVWKAVEAMILGLKKQSKRKVFEITMSTFGDFNDKVCFGCAATCTVQQVYGKNFNRKNIAGYESRAKFMKAISEDLAEFESAIDGLRMGYLGDIFKYFKKKMPVKIYRVTLSLSELSSSNWEVFLPDYENLLTKLKALDI